MRNVMGLLVLLCALHGVACGSDTNETTGSSGGSPTTSTASQGGGGQGGAGGCVGEDPHDNHCFGGGFPSGGGGSGTGGASPEYTVDALADVSIEGLKQLAEDGVACSPVSRLANEEGSWTRVTMRTPATDGSVSLRWIAVRQAGTAIPETWQVVVYNVGIGLDPEQAPCGVGAGDVVPYEEGSAIGQDEAGNTIEFVVLVVDDFASTGAGDGSHFVACLRNYVDADPTTAGDQSSAILLCGAPDAGNPERDQWQDNPEAGGAIHDMCSYGPNYCGSWLVTVK